MHGKEIPIEINFILPFAIPKSSSLGTDEKMITDIFREYESKYNIIHLYDAFNGILKEIKKRGFADLEGTLDLLYTKKEAF